MANGFEISGGRSAIPRFGYASTLCITIRVCEVREEPLPVIPRTRHRSGTVHGRAMGDVKAIFFFLKLDNFGFLEK